MLTSSGILTIVGIVTVLALMASGGALFVSMKVSSSLNKFKMELVNELDERYVRTKDHSQFEAMRIEMEQNYRATTKGQIEGIQVEVKRDKDDLTIALKGILAAINEHKVDSRKGRG